MKKWAHYVLEVLSDCRRALQAGSAAITQIRLCVPTAFDSIKCNTGSSNLHGSIQSLTIAAVLFYYGLKCILTGFSLPFRACWRDLELLFLFWCIEGTEAILLTPTSFPWHGQPTVELSMLIALSGAKPPAPSSRAALGICWVERGCEGGMGNEGATDQPHWCCLTFHTISSSMEGMQGSVAVG